MEGQTRFRHTGAQDGNSTGAVQAHVSCRTGVIQGNESIFQSDHRELGQVAASVSKIRMPTKGVYLPTVLQHPSGSQIHNLGSPSSPGS